MRRGFTLIELIIVILIIGVSTALVSPSLSRLSKTTALRTTAQKVAAILRNSRSEAVNKGRIYQVLFNADLRELKVRWMKPNEEEGEGEEKKEKPPIPGYGFPEGIFMKEIELKGAQYDSELPAIEFYPNGGSNGGSFLLEDEDRKGYRIKIHFLTGMVEIIKV